MSVISTLSFWSKAADKVYDECVLGELAPPDVKEFLKHEDLLLENVVNRYIENDEDFIFLEIGSGTGRYIRYFGEKLITERNFDKHLRFIIGVDFCPEMIEKSIKHLVGKKTKPESLLEKVKKSRLLSDSKDIERKLRSRILFINANAAYPFLKISGMKVIVAIMFGTLGNFSPAERDLFLKINIDRILENGEVAITVFDRKKMQNGFTIYRNLARSGFDLLKPLVTHNSEFTSPEGFYSHWFTHHKFKSLLEEHFENGCVKITPFKHAFFGKVKIRKTISLHRSLNLLCPKCGEILGKLPLTSTDRVKCASCRSSYETKEFLGFRFPKFPVNIMGEKKLGIQQQ